MIDFARNADPVPFLTSPPSPTVFVTNISHQTKRKSQLPVQPMTHLSHRRIIESDRLTLLDIQQVYLRIYLHNKTSSQKPPCARLAFSHRRLPSAVFSHPERLFPLYPPKPARKPRFRLAPCVRAANWVKSHLLWKERKGKKEGKGRGREKKVWFMQDAGMTCME